MIDKVRNSKLDLDSCIISWYLSYQTFRDYMFNSYTHLDKKVLK